MKWFFLRYDGDIAPHILHPYAAKARIKDIEERYGQRPIKIERRHDNAWIDLGGMCRVGEPIITIQLGRERSLYVPTYQASEVAAKLQKRLGQAAIWLGGRQWIRTSTFPGILLYLSLRDTRRIIKRLLEEEDHAEARRQEMLAALGRANAPAFQNNPQMN